MRTQITNSHPRRAAAASRDANSCPGISPRRDAMHLPARALGPLPHVLKPPHAAHGQPRQRRREILIGRQLRHALTAETPEHLGDLRSTHHRKLHTPQFRRLLTRRLPTRRLPTRHMPYGDGMSRRISETVDVAVRVAVAGEVIY